MEETVTKRILKLLEESSLSYRHLQHEATPTSADSARARNEPIEHGAKALLLKVDDTFTLFIMSAARRLDSKVIKKHFSAKKIRFATTEELFLLTGLVPGSVPPFGQPILSFDHYADTSLQTVERVGFNIGLLTESVIMSSSDYLALSNPKAIFSFTEPA